ncbi:DNA recombination protein RmuC [Rivibacter subsaxonicus]|uniref:DNA recombination protein RmuC n=1 Tax=Rivibacter subsaxonicus TaxID=457575 RepID=A0A4Q7VEY1_9BURK|nr:DNA recombination protein RmuC [Rivibacter subsaxonicus]RZT93748.1 DNA recombination protein RmuC [Rivibacter subsaxonicus]
MTDWLLPLLAALAALNLLLLLWLALRRRDDAATRELGAGLDRVERTLRADLADSGRGTRQELSASISLFQQTLLAQSGDVARTQNEQIDSFRTQLAAMQQAIADTLRSSTGTLTQSQQGAREAQDAALQRFGAGLTEQLRAMSEANEKRLGEVRNTVEERLTKLATDNETKLEQMRQTVDEKLQTTLETRLGESFKQVAERLEQVHRGLGEMQTLATGVGDLKRVLSNVKSRGVFGEVQLALLLEQVFTPEQYATNIATVPGSNERVEFALRMPGRSDDPAQVLWLPIDAKFPREDYERLLDAQDRADRAEAEAAGKALEQRIRDEAKTIAAKYVSPPFTTDFALLFVPTEGLYAELLRRPGLVELLQREHKVTLAGPTTLLAMLNTLQMGFRTLALEKRSAEVWQVLGAVKTEFGKFGTVLGKIRDQTQSVIKTLDAADTRTRAMTRALRGVESMPEAQAQALLPGAELTELDDEASA